jgi:hypothetical protein
MATADSDLIIVTLEEWLTAYINYINSTITNERLLQYLIKNNIDKSDVTADKFKFNVHLKKSNGVFAKDNFNFEFGIATFPIINVFDIQNYGSIITMFHQSFDFIDKALTVTDNRSIYDIKPSKKLEQNLKTFSGGWFREYTKLHINTNKIMKTHRDIQQNGLAVLFDGIEKNDALFDIYSHFYVNEKKKIIGKVILGDFSLDDRFMVIISDNIPQNRFTKSEKIPQSNAPQINTSDAPDLTPIPQDEEDTMYGGNRKKTKRTTKRTTKRKTKKNKKSKVSKRKSASKRKSMSKHK